MQENQLPDLKTLELDMLQRFAEICTANHLTYYLADGSLLGAVRHKGFIPWDDDIDVLMPYADFKRFLEIGQDMLGQDFFLQSTQTDKNWYRVYATIRKENTSMIQNPAYHVHQGVWLDIFILGNARSKLECRLQKALVMVCNYLLMDHYMCINREEFSKRLTPVGFWAFQQFYRIPWRTRFALRQQIMDWIGKDKGGRFFPEIWCAITDVYPSACFEKDCALVEFEGSFFHAPHDPDLFLRTQYGDDYMTPIQWSRGHEHILLDLSRSYSEYLK